MRGALSYALGVTRSRFAFVRHRTARRFAIFAALPLASAACSFVRSFDGFDVGGDAGGDGGADAATRTDGANGTDGGAGLKCAADHRACDAIRACVLPTDPNFGCGVGDCRACDGTNASAVVCANVAGQPGCRSTCRAGYAHCTEDAGGGCETDLSKKANCGSCGNTCDAGVPYCARTDAGDGFGCVASCPTGLDKCGDECVSTSDNVDNCGACDKRCTAPANAHPTCFGGACNYECNVGAHRCGADCAPDNDVHRCGASCGDCSASAPPNMVPSCQAGACAYACAAGFHDCSGDPGCETFGDCSSGTEVSGGN